MRKYAFGAIDLLIGIVLITAVFLISMKSFKPISNNASDIKSVQEQVDEQVAEIEEMRQKAIDYQKEMLSEE